jgi:hypothetical protein
MMMNLELWLEGLVAILLAITVVYCFILNRRLGALRGAQEEMMQLTADFSEAMRKAQGGISDLRRAGDDIGQDLQNSVNEARGLCDDLRVMTQSGEDLANRLDLGLAGGRASAKAKTDPAPTAEEGDHGASESELERELREAFRRAR